MERPVSDMHSLMEKVLNSSLNGLYIYDLQEGVNIFINPQYTKITGYTLQDINSLSEPELFALFHPEDHASVLRHVEAINRSADGDILEIEYRFKTADGRWIWCLSWDTVIDRSNNGEALRFLGTFLDITHRKNNNRFNYTCKKRMCNIRILHYFWFCHR